MFKVTIDKGDIHADMPYDNHLDLFEAFYRADICKKRNPKATFTVVNEENGDVEYQV